MKKLVLLLALVVVVSGCKRGETPAGSSGRGGAGKTATAATTTGTEVGFAMPDYSAMNLDGTKFDLAGRRGKVVLLNVWATWCGPCIFEIPELQRIHDAYAARGFEVVGVSVDESGVEAVKQFVDDKKMRYPVALDPQGQLASLLQTSVLPTSVLVDRGGKIVWKKTGAILENDQELDEAIKKAL
jgi:thiol-disulfide isomerase/thioredoxin